MDEKKIISTTDCLEKNKQQYQKPHLQKIELHDTKITANPGADGVSVS